MSIINPDFGLLFWMAIVFLVVLFILWRWGFPVIIKMTNDRKAYIDDSLRKAHEANEKLANVKAESETILQETRGKQANILKEANTMRDDIVEKAQSKAREEGNRLLSEAKAEIENQKQAAMNEIRAQVAELSVQVATKILMKELNSEDKQMEMIDRLLDEVTSSDKK